MNLEKVSRQTRKLLVVRDSFQQAVALLDYIEKIDLCPASDLYTPMLAGIVTTYMKNFVSSDGFGPLPHTYSKFPNSKRMEKIHQKMIDSRNSLYAHREDNENIKITVTLIGTALEFVPTDVVLNPSILKEYRELIEFQLDRINNDFDGKVACLLENGNGSFEIGRTYILGDTFP